MNATHTVPPDIDYGIVTIKEEEFRALQTRFGAVELIRGRNRRYFKGVVRTRTGRLRTVALARCVAQGQGEAQSVTSDLIADLNPCWILVVGIAGAVPAEEFGLGDVLLASRLLDFSVQAAIEGGPPELDTSGGWIHPSVVELLSIIPGAAEELGPWNTPDGLGRVRPALIVPDDLGDDRYYGDDSSRLRVRNALRTRFREDRATHQPRLRIGGVASSNTLVKDTQLVREWKSAARSITHIEMELGGVYRAAWTRSQIVPVLSVRGISDIVGFRRDAEWTDYACETAAAFAGALIRSDLPFFDDSSTRTGPAIVDLPGAAPEDLPKDVHQEPSASRRLGESLVAEREAHDLSRNPEFASFQFLGFHTSAATVDLVALCDADAMTESDVVRLRDEFFGLVRQLPHDLGLKPRGRNPNGLLGFVFSDGCPEPMARLIARQTRISHAEETGGVSVAWAIDARNRRIHTHDNPVSILPPVIVPARTVYPGLEFLESLLGRLPALASTERSAQGDHPPMGAHGLASRLASRREPSTEPASPTPAELHGAQPGKIHILFLAANSVDAPLDLEWELSQIKANLRLAKERGRLELTPVMAATIDEVMQAMLDAPPTIVHFSGHGRSEGVVLRDGSGNPHLVACKALASLLSLFRETVNCVVLNACWSESQARAIREHIPYVIGTRAMIPDRAAIAFSTGFYKAIAAGKDVPFAFRMGLTRVQAEGEDVDNLVALFSSDDPPVV